MALRCPIACRGARHGPRRDPTLTWNKVLTLNANGVLLPNATIIFAATSLTAYTYAHRSRSASVVVLGRGPAWPVHGRCTARASRWHGQTDTYQRDCGHNTPLPLRRGCSTRLAPPPPPPEDRPLPADLDAFSANVIANNGLLSFYVQRWCAGASASFVNPGLDDNAYKTSNFAYERRPHSP